MIRDILRQRGINIDEDDETFLNRAVQARQFTGQNYETVQQYRQHEAEFREFMAAKQAETQRQKEEAAKARWSGEPIDWDDSLMQYIRQDEAGNLVAVPGAPPGLVDRYNQARVAEANRLRAFARDPDKFIAPFQDTFKQNILAEVREMVTNELLAPRDQYITADQIIREIQPHMIATDPATGRQVPTMFGVRYNQLAHEAAQYGINDPKAMHTYALNHINQEYAFYRQHGQGMFQQPAPVAPAGMAAPAAAVPGANPLIAASEAAKQRYVQSAAHVPSQAGALRSGAGTNGANNELAGMSLLERLKRNLEGVPIE